MKTPEEYEERNIKVLIEAGQRVRPFVVTYVQRLCRIGYNQAMHTIERAIKQGVLVRDADCEFRYRFTS